MDLLTEQPPLSAGFNPDQYIDDEQAADLLGLSRSFMRKLRVAGGGCPYAVLGKRAIRYRVGDLLAWAASKSTTSTSDQEAA